VQNTQESTHALALPERIRDLRLHHWPDLKITQRQLGQALGDDHALSESLISSWESQSNRASPSPMWLAAYARFFASRRSIESGVPKLLADTELTADERAEQNRLLAELMELSRTKTLTDDKPEAPAPSAERVQGGTWHFPDRHQITIVCARLPDKMLQQMPYTDQMDPDFVRYYTFADLDALVELHGHVRAANPDSRVNIRTADALSQDRYTDHLILLGGVDWNASTGEILRRLRVPVRQDTRPDDAEYDAAFIRTDNDSVQRYAPVLDRDTAPPILREDISLFVRGPNPFNVRHTVTICNGIYSRGVYGAVRALTDERFRDLNEKYLHERFGDEKCFCLLGKVNMGFNGETLTPDWSVAENRLYEWSRPDEDDG
jgi:hypothetical protein